MKNEEGLPLLYLISDKNEEKLVILNLIGKIGWSLFKEDTKDYDEVDVPKENSGYDKGKTPAQRLRAVIYVFWEKHKKNDYPDFNDYYEKQLETLIIQYKNKIE